MFFVGIFQKEELQIEELTMMNNIINQQVCKLLFNFNYVWYKFFSDY